MYNIAKLSSIFTFLPLEIFWIIIGPLYLLFSIGKDLFYVFKILCDYQQEEDHLKEKEEEDFKQDKIVIYNEVMDVMRSVLHLFEKRKLNTYN
jgi:putative lipase involved disintegration of autophagic bodies